MSFKALVDNIKVFFFWLAKMALAKLVVVPDTQKQQYWHRSVVVVVCCLLLLLFDICLLVYVRKTNAQTQNASWWEKSMESS